MGRGGGRPPSGGSSGSGRSGSRRGRRGRGMKAIEDDEVDIDDVRANIKRQMAQRAQEQADEEAWSPTQIGHETPAMEMQMNALTRMLEADSGYIHGAAVNERIMQRHALLEDIKTRNEVLAKELMLHDREMQQRRQEQKVGREADKLDDKVIEFEKGIHHTKQRIEMLDKQLMNIRKKKHEQQQHMKGEYASKSNNLLMGKAIRDLERQLKRKLELYNEKMLVGQDLRARIDEQHTLRLRFDSVYADYERQMHSLNDLLPRLANALRDATDRRDKLVEGFHHIKDKADREQRELLKSASNINAVMQKGHLKGKLVAEADNATGAKKAELMKQVGEMSMEEEKALKKAVVKSRWRSAKSKIASEISAERAQAFETVFSQMLQASGTTNVQELVDKFIEEEKRNFSQMKMLNDYQSEIDKHQDDCQQLRDEITRYHAMKHGAHAQRKKFLEDLEKKRDQMEKDTAEVERNCSRLENALDLFKESIMKLFLNPKIGCETVVSRDNMINVSTTADDLRPGGMLGEEWMEKMQQIGDSNVSVMQHMGVIEQRVREIVNAHGRMERREEAKRMASLKKQLGGKNPFARRKAAADAEAAAEAEAKKGEGAEGGEGTDKDGAASAIGSRPTTASTRPGSAKKVTTASKAARAKGSVAERRAAAARRMSMQMGAKPTERQPSRGRGGGGGGKKSTMRRAKESLDTIEKEQYNKSFLAKVQGWEAKIAAPSVVEFSQFCSPNIDDTQGGAEIQPVQFSRIWQEPWLKDLPDKYASGRLGSPPSPRDDRESRARAKAVSRKDMAKMGKAERRAMIMKEANKAGAMRGGRRGRRR